MDQVFFFPNSPSRLHCLLNIMYNGFNNLFKTFLFKAISNQATTVGSFEFKEVILDSYDGIAESSLLTVYVYHEFE